jgi:hypothetical protein
MENKSAVTQILLAIIVLALVSIIFILLTTNKGNKAVSMPTVSPDPIHGVNEKDKEILADTVKPTEITSQENFVHPPAEGRFDSSAVSNFKSSYNKSSRIFTISANVVKGFMFEANVPYKVYDSKGRLLVHEGTTAYGQDAQSINDSTLPIDIQFKVPTSIVDGEILVFRILADNPSDLREYDAYWGTTLKVQ